jgi:8-oxo-dGTP pyrophosphatase MutT (NUDIX family)
MEKGLGVKGLIMDEEQVLVLVEPDGRVDLPGGRVEEGEALPVCLEREVREEVNIDVEIQSPMVQWAFIKTAGLEISGTTYLCRYTGGDIRLSHEHTGYSWVELEKLYEPRFMDRGRLGTYLGAS